jgi:hypothetical protein
MFAFDGNTTAAVRGRGVPAADWGVGDGTPAGLAASTNTTVFVSNLRNDERFFGDNAPASLSQMCVPLCPQADGVCSAPAVVLKLVNRKAPNGAAAALPFDRADVKRVVEIFGGLLLKQLAAVDHEALGMLGGCDGMEKGGAKGTTADKPVTCTIVPQGAENAAVDCTLTGTTKIVVP